MLHRLARGYINEAATISDSAEPSLHILCTIVYIDPQESAGNPNFSLILTLLVRWPRGLMHFMHSAVNVPIKPEPYIHSVSLNK